MRGRPVSVRVAAAIHSARNPVFQRTDIESFAAFMRDGGRWFQQQRLRPGWWDNPACQARCA